MPVIKEKLERCTKCGLYKSICICSHISKTDLKTRLTLLIHSKEIRRQTNTGRFACLCLENSALIIRGNKEINHLESDILTEGYEHRILFPHATEVLTPDMSVINGKPLNLIVPDGTWHQAKKIIVSESYLRTVKRVKLPDDLPSSYFLRKTDDPTHISTLEAIARSFGVVESMEARKHLEKVFYEMTTGLLRLRGY